MPLPPRLGASLAAQLAGIRQGASVALYKGASYNCIVRPLSEEEVGELVMQGSGLNAASANAYEFSFSPADFAGGLPAPGEAITWNGVSYTLTRRAVTEIGSVAVAARYPAYATPVLNTTADDAAQLAKWT